MSRYYTQEQFDTAAELILNGFTREGAAAEAVGSWESDAYRQLVEALPNDDFDTENGRLDPTTIKIGKIRFPPVRGWGAAYCTICAWECESTYWAKLDGDHSQHMAIMQDVHDEAGACKAEVSWNEFGREVRKAEGDDDADTVDGPDEPGLGV